MARRLWILSLLAVTLTVALAAPSQKSKRSVTVEQPSTSTNSDGNTTPSKNVTLSQGGSTTDGDEDYSGEYDVLITDGDGSEHQQPQKTDEHKENQAKENEKKIQ
ncbi:glycoprotein UL22A [Human betaherpesvirus 5]|uniref:Glycoprotein UL22A n=1 Tax=Human cytomegalovirus TaxID=10359 RepID=A0A0G2UEH8_HCMV|nr:putative glycoprotein [Human betaherpesvirus 5]AAL08522.1 putative glycoprotein [Human betaherpesvirus 5]AKI14939.1 glycoprotein UL22A [Human betaherpesvirus 5]AKI23127.1 glycoprotein UL22A [Human betaherpesvirus 5]AQN71158.1 glycoprotein UL22A [Human betaherpesvirus 5]